MVGGGGIRYAESYGDAVEKSDVRFVDVLLREIISHVKHQLVLACVHFLGGEQWLIGSPVCIGPDRFEQFRFFIADRPEFDLHVRGGMAIRGIQNVSAE